MRLPNGLHVPDNYGEWDGLLGDGQVPSFAYGNQTVTADKVGLGYLALTVNSVSASVAPWKIVGVDEIDVGGEIYEHLGANTGGTTQIAAIFETKEPVNRLVLTVDEVPDIDATTYQGAQVDVWLFQAFPKSSGSNTGWELKAAKAWIRYMAVTPSAGPEFNRPTTVKIEITPYNDPGTATTTFSNTATR